jgi:hypothetical protein
MPFQGLWFLSNNYVSIPGVRNSIFLNKSEGKNNFSDRYYRYLCMIYNGSQGNYVGTLAEQKLKKVPSDTHIPIYVLYITDNL